jgi:hypothetical protein
MGSPHADHISKERTWITRGRSLARALDKTEAGSYVFERLVYRSIDKMPKQVQGRLVATVGRGTKHIGHGLRVAVDKVWQRWG